MSSRRVAIRCSSAFQRPVFRQGRNIGVHVAGDARLFVLAQRCREKLGVKFGLTEADQLGQGLGLAGQVAAFETAQGQHRRGQGFEARPRQLGFQRFQGLLDAASEGGAASC